MDLKKSIANEFEAAPITVSAAIVGLAIAFVSLIAGWPPSDTPVTSPDSDIATAATGVLHYPNLILLASFFLASTLSAASLVRLIARRHPFPAFFLSVILADITIFFTICIYKFSPPRFVSTEQLEAIGKTAFWGCLLYTSPSPRDQRGSRMPSSA